MMGAEMSNFIQMSTQKGLIDAQQLVYNQVKIWTLPKIFNSVHNLFLSIVICLKIKWYIIQSNL